VQVPPRGRRGTSSYLLLLLAAHSRTCRPAHTRPAPQVLGDHGTRLQSEIVRVAASHPGSWRADCMRQVRRADCCLGPRPQADRRDVAMRVNQSAGGRTARSSPPSHTPRPRRYQMNRREPGWERAACRGRSGSRWRSAERRPVSEFIQRQAMGSYSCFREGRTHLGWSSSEYTPEAGPLRPVCPPITSRQHFENIPRQP
jgi:hypothetical protein